MSLIRQIWLLMLGTVLLAFAGSVTVAVESARGYLQTQLRLKNADNATSLALALSQQKGDKELMALLMSAQFDTGFYRRIRFSNADSSLGFVREAQATPTTAPAWFVNLSAEPRVEVQIKGDRFTANARVATPAEKPAMWAKMVEAWPDYDEYTKKTDREIPIVVLERA
jgi:deazaflavin-dependent oxidoreductase (nitroreductase family)